MDHLAARPERGRKCPGFRGRYGWSGCNKSNYDVCRGSFRIEDGRVSIDAWLPADHPDAAGLVPGAPTELEVGQGDRFADGLLPRGRGVGTRRR